MKKIFLMRIIVLMVCSFFVAHGAFAQEAPPQEDTGEEIEAEVLATVNLESIEVLDQKDNKFTVKFTLTNRIGVQPQIRYALSIAETLGTGGEIIAGETVYKKSYDKAISLNENDSVTQTVDFQVPTNLNEEYILVFEAYSDNGFPFVYYPVDPVFLQGDGAYIKVVNSTCFVTINGQEGAYSLGQGIDIAKDEKIQLKCIVKNNTAADASLTPHFTTYARTVSSDLIGEADSQDIVYVEVGEEKEVTITIPTESIPQAYDAVMDLRSDQKILSNETIIHYVVQGASGTIQTAQLDKDFYTAGDTAEVKVYITGNADGFFGARAGVQDNTQGNTITLQIEDDKNNMCSKKITENVTDDIINNFLHKKITIDYDCTNPTLNATLTDKDGNILDESIFRVETKSRVVADDSEALSGRSILIGVLVATAILIIMILLWSRFRGKGNTPIATALFLIGFGAVLFTVHAPVAEADTIRIDGKHIDVTATVSVTKNNSNCTARATGRIYVDMCNNVPHTNEYLHAQVDGGDFRKIRELRCERDSGLGAHESRICRVEDRTIDLGVFESGSHSVRFKLQTRAYGIYAIENDATRYHTMYFSLPTSCDPPANGDCGPRHERTGEWTASGLLSYGACSSGSYRYLGWSVERSRWEWDCEGRNDGTDSEICWAQPLTVNGTCSTGQIQIPIPYTQTGWLSFDPTHFCATGTPVPTPSPETFPAQGQTVTWGCTGANGGTSTTSDECSAERLRPRAACEDLSDIHNTTPDTGLLCSGCDDCSVTEPVLGIDGRWTWTCTHNVSEADPLTASCSAPSCLAGLPIDLQRYVYFDSDGSPNNATVRVTCPNVCCEIEGQSIEVGGEQRNSVCTGDSGEIRVSSGENLFNARCWFDGGDGNFDDDDEPRVFYEDLPVGTMCIARSCNAQGTCQSTPQSANSPDACTQTCSSDADCSSGRMIETRP